MELFKITCVTCRARLSVRDAALVGQIIGCPRCGMMVQVTSPAGASPLAESAAAPLVVLSSTIPPSENTFSEASSLAAADVVTSVSAFEITTTFDDDANAIFTSAPTAATLTIPPPVVATAASRWTTYKFAGLVLAGAIAGSAAVAAALAWFNEDNQTAAANPTAKVVPINEQPNDLTPPAASTELDDGLAASAASDPEPEAFLPVETPDDALGQAAPAEPAEPAEPEPTPPAPNDAFSFETIPPAAELAEPVVTDAPPDETAPEPRLRIDPLDVDPEGLNLSTLYSGPPKDPLAESPLPKGEDASDSVPPAEPQPDDVEVVAIEPAVRRDAHAGVGAPADAAPLLARRLPAVTLQKMPLCRLLDFSSQVSGLPVSVAPDQFRMAAVSAATPASVDAKDATIEQLLTAALKPLRLKPVIDGDQIVLQREGDDKRRTVDYPVDDLASSPAQVERLARWVEQLAAPESWQAGGGEATLTVDGAKLRVDAPVSVQYEVLFVLERYRLARGLPTRTKYPAALLASGAFHAAVAERMAAPAVFTFAQYTPLREIFRYWQEELDVAVLVDWPALADERLWPEARIACSGADKSWGEAMDSVLEPLGLGWRAVGRNTIEITTLTKIREEQMLEVYRVAADASVDAEQLVGRVQSLAEEDAKPPATADLRQAAVGIAYDAESRVLLVRQPAAGHRALVAAMGDLLDSMPVESAK